MEPYRRDTADEPLRDPETGEVVDRADTADDDRTHDDRTDDDRTVYDQAEHRDTHGVDEQGRDTGGPGRDDVLDAPGDPLQNPDPVHDSDDGELADPSERAETARDEKVDGPGERSDLIVYPEEADYPTRSQDSGLTAGVPDLEPEPVPAPGDDDVSHQVTGTAADSGVESIDYQQRWREVQAGFVDDPRDAVQRADQLVEEAVTALTTRRQGLVDRWKNSDQNDTEQLRLALRDYRSLLEELVGLSYSTPGQAGSPARHEAR
jgi:hypothetical protein